MLIGIDGNEANQDTRVGVGRYAMELLLQFHNFQIPNSKFQIYLKDKPRNHMPGVRDGWDYEIVGPRVLWTQIGLPVSLFLHKKKPDVFFTPTHYAPRFCPVPSVMSIMDTSYLLYPEMFRKRDLYKLKRWTRYSVNNAAKILTISQASRADIIKIYKVNPERVVVTYPGIDMITSQGDNKILVKHGIRPGYILYVGTIQPRKNLVCLIESFNLLKDKSLQLVVVGKKGWLFNEIFARVKELKLESRVIFTGFVTDEDLITFYTGAKLLVLVSLYEGFGLPALEAMSHGKPVVVSNVSSLPEIVGEAGILVDPKDSASIASGIAKVLSMSDLDYNKISDLSKLQANKFNWETTAKETLKVLQDVVVKIG